MGRLVTLFAAVSMICLPLSTASAQSAPQRGKAAGEIFSIPDHLENRWGGLSREELAQAEQLVSLGLQQDEELNRRIQSVLRHPSEFATTEVDRALDDLLKLTINLGRLVWIKAGAGSNPHVSSWSVVDTLLDQQRIDDAVSNLARRAAQKPGCELKDLQLKGLPQVFWFEYAMAKYDYEQKSCGALPSSDWLSQMNISRLSRLRALIGDESRSFAHTELVFVFQPSCKTAKALSLESQLGICSWTKEKVDLGPRRKTPLQRKDAFQFFPLKNSAFAGASKANVEALLLKASTPNSAEKVSRTIKEISNTQRPGITSGYWLSPDRSILVFLIDIEPLPSSNRPTYLSPLEQWNRYLVLVTDSKHSFIGVPGGFGQYDDGQLLGISDIDRDGNIEVWFSAEWGECDGEDSVAGINCAITHFFRLEQFGSDLAPFVPGRRPKSSQR